jgi:hypothetical protein
LRRCASSSALLCVCDVACRTLSQHGMFDFLKIPQHVAISYFRRLETSYFENPYANSIGALRLLPVGSRMAWHGMAWHTRRTAGLVIGLVCAVLLLEGTTTQSTARTCWRRCCSLSEASIGEKSSPWVHMRAHARTRALNHAHLHALSQASQTFTHGNAHSLSCKR